MDAREIIIEQIKKEVLKPGNKRNLAELYDQYGFLLTKAISDAISPVNVLTAPITIAYLEGYAETLRKEFPMCDEFVDEIKKGKSVAVTKQVK